MKVMSQVSQKAQGRVRCSIVQDGQVVKEFPWQKNLILNQGLNDLCQNYNWETSITYCAAGTGTTNTNEGTLSGQTGSGSVATFTGPGSFDFTTSAAVGDMIKMTTGSDSGTEVRITAISDATHVTYTPSGTIAPGEFIVYHTSQVGLSVEVKRNNTYSALTRTWASNVYTIAKTYEFTAESGSVSYTELGLSASSGAGNNLFSRIKLASPVALIAGQQLRVYYELAITVTPNTSTPKTFNITGWPVSPSTTTDGDEMLQDKNYMFGGSPSSGAGLEPAAASGAIFLATGSTLAAFGSGPSYGAISPKTHSLVSYTPLNFYRDRTVTFGVLDAVGTTWRSMGFGPGSTGSMGGVAFMCVFDEAQTKLNTHTLTLTFRISVGRVLG